VPGFDQVQFRRQAAQHVPASRLGSCAHSKVESPMKEIAQKVSMWTRLHRRWEKIESDLRLKTPTPEEPSSGMCAMQVELRAMRAKADIAPPGNAAGTADRR
jgi:hypothetical protein